ncbi:stalk domain-containing protein [Sedimentibacter sp.]|uniref:stalk domain-containing protein n=1 Tax=Sedimentibacter sp. TaxID=1960295 RepID=UPI0028B23387|nr:stalk domain-containing protein [Sedimentibacter sp.]
MKRFLTICLSTFIATATVFSLNTYAADYSASNFLELENVLFEQMRDYNEVFDIKYTGSLDNIEDILKNVVDRDPYLDSNIKSVGWKIEGTKKVSNINVNVDYIITKTERIQADKQIDNILSEIINPYMNDHEKVKAVHDYIILNGKYDEEKLLYSDYDLLTQGKSVCNGYALLTYNMLNKLNIPVKLVTGTGNSELHIWNMVKLSGHWFHLDTTWNDPLPDENTISYNYYMLTDNEISADHIIDENLDLPTANKSYYTLLKELSYDKLLMETGLDIYDDVNTAKSENELKNILTYKIKHRPLKISVRIHNSISQDIVNSAMSSLLRNDSVSIISYDSPLKTDNSGEYKILNLYVNYKETPDSIEFESVNKVYNTATKANFSVYAIYGNKKVNITKDVLLYPYKHEGISIYEGTMTFKKPGSYSLTFEFQGLQQKVSITALNSNAFEFITNKKPDNPINVKVYDQYINFSSINQWPFIENGRTMVPLRAVFEVLNCNVNWDTETNSAIVEYEGTKIIIPADSNVAYINGTESALDAPAKLVNNRIMVPLRFISEAIDKIVLWDDKDKTVLIY